MHVAVKTLALALWLDELHGGVEPSLPLIFHVTVPVGAGLELVGPASGAVKVTLVSFVELIVVAPVTCMDGGALTVSLLLTTGAAAL